MTKVEDEVNQWGPYSPVAVQYRMRLVDFTRSQDLSADTISIYWNLRNLSRLKEADAFWANVGDFIENIPFTDTADRLERNIIPFTQVDPLSKSTQQFAIFTLFGYAALIHMYLFMRDCSKDLPFSHMLSNRTRMVLEQIDMPIFEKQFPEMMLWIYIMGGLSGSSVSERVWFATRVTDFCFESGLFGGNDIAATLHDFLWSELYRSPVTRRFWEEVAKAQGFHTGYEVRRLADHVSVTCFNAPPDSDA